MEGIQTPLYDLRCSSESCDITFEEYVSLAQYPWTPQCPKCGADTHRSPLRPAQRVPPDPVVVYQAPDGTFRFPPDAASSSTAMYDKQGMTRIELRGWQDVRRFEKHMNAAEMSKVRQRVERQAEQHEAMESARRSEIRREMEQGFRIPETDDRGRPTGRMKTVVLSERGRALMREAQEKNDRKGGPKANEVGFHSEVYSQDRSNRIADPRSRYK